jgi:hypothetical protein
MKVLIAKSIYVLPDSEYFFLAIGYKHWSIGVKVLRFSEAKQGL